jgi:hypothetical protein
MRALITGYIVTLLLVLSGCYGYGEIRLFGNESRGYPIPPLENQYAATSRKIYHSPTSHWPVTKSIIEPLHIKAEAIVQELRLHTEQINSQARQPIPRPDTTATVRPADPKPERSDELFASSSHTPQKLTEPWPEIIVGYLSYSNGRVVDPAFPELVISPPLIFNVREGESCKCWIVRVFPLGEIGPRWRTEFPLNSPSFGRKKFTFKREFGELPPTLNLDKAADTRSQ